MAPRCWRCSRQNLPALRDDDDENLCLRGGYRLISSEAELKVVVLATGSEVQIAVKIAEMLEAEDIGADVVSMPCWELFEAQDADYRDNLIPDDLLVVSIEAGTTMGWHKYVGRDGLAIGIDSFRRIRTGQRTLQAFRPDG